MRPLVFTLGPFHLYGYGAMVVTGGVLFFWLLRRRMKAIGIKTDDDFWVLVNVLLLSGFLGGRFLFVFEYTRWFSADFWKTLVSPASGYSVLGSFVAVPLASWWYCRWKQLSFLRLFDTVCALAPFWHAVGRLGCLLAGCCFGRPTDEPWGVVFTDPRSQIPQVWLGVPLHPTQLYEALGNALIGAGLCALLVRTASRRPGLVIAAYFAAYGVLRFFEEYYRGDTVPLGFLGLTGGQGLSLGLVAASLGLLAWRSACSRPS
ncbi:MAG: prolipoprotein diacylglyceryl transferase [Elusimicrobiota bacterium]